MNKKTKAEKNSVKQNKGITLIALVITIIVMLILVVVTVNIAMDGGLFTKAKEGANSTQLKADEETLIAAVAGAYNGTTAEINDSELKNALSDWNVEGNGPWTCTSPKGNTFTVSKTGKITDGGSVSPQEDEELNALKELVIGKSTDFLDGLEAITYYASSEDLVIDGDITYFIKYGNSVYSVYSSDDINCESVEIAYRPTGREGQKIEYSYDGSEDNKKEWTILYDYGDTIEIVSPDAFNKQFDFEESSSMRNWDVVAEAYNSMIDTFNVAANEIITNENKISVRSTGTNPSNPQDEQQEYFDIPENLPDPSNSSSVEPGTVSIKSLKKGDYNYIYDCIRLYYFGILNEPGEYSFYMLGSRSVDYFPDEPELRIGVLKVYGTDNIESISMLEYYHGWRLGNNMELIRPIVKISSTAQ